MHVAHGDLHPVGAVCTDRPESRADYMMSQGNILVDAVGDVKLSDFFCADLTSSSDEAVPGVARYMAPGILDPSTFYLLISKRCTRWKAERPDEALALGGRVFDPPQWHFLHTSCPNFVAADNKGIVQQKDSIMCTKNIEAVVVDFCLNGLRAPPA